MTADGTVIRLAHCFSDGKLNFSKLAPTASPATRSAMHAASSSNLHTLNSKVPPAYAYAFQPSGALSLLAHEPRSTVAEAPMGSNSELRKSVPVSRGAQHVQSLGGPYSQSHSHSHSQSHSHIQSHSQSHSHSKRRSSSRTSLSSLPNGKSTKSAAAPSENSSRSPDAYEGDSFNFVAANAAAAEATNMIASSSSSVAESSPVSPLFIHGQSDSTPAEEQHAEAVLLPRTTGFTADQTTSTLSATRAEATASSTLAPTTSTGTTSSSSALDADPDHEAQDVSSPCEDHEPVGAEHQQDALPAHLAPSLDTLSGHARTHMHGSSEFASADDDRNPLVTPKSEQVDAALLAKKGDFVDAMIMKSHDTLAEYK